MDYENGDYFFNKYECISSNLDRVIGLSFFNGLVRKIKQQPMKRVIRRTGKYVNGKEVVQMMTLYEAEQDRERWIREHNFTKAELEYYEWLFGKDNCKIARF